MAKQLIGEEGFTFEDIKNLFHGNLSQSQIKTRWEDFSLYLDTPKPMQDSIRNYFFLDDSNRLDAILAMLVDWRQRKSNEATIAALLDIIKKIKEWKCLEDHLQELTITKAIMWTDLDENSKEKALQHKVFYKGNVETLSFVQGFLTKHEFDTLFSPPNIQTFFSEMRSGGVVNLDKLIQNDLQDSRSNAQAIIASRESVPQSASQLIASVERNLNSISKPKAHPNIEPSTVLDMDAELHSDLSEKPRAPFKQNTELSHYSKLHEKLVTAEVSNYLSNNLTQEEITSTEIVPELIKCSNIRLGTGSADTNVYEGTFGTRKVAVKVLSNFRDQILAENEIKFLLQCDKHENIVRYIHSEKTPYAFLIALELCDKSTLADWVDDSTCIRIKIDPIQVLRQTTQGLGFLHQLKPIIIHRDLKPSNILFQVRGSDVVVKISDFGISRSLTPGRNTRTVTRFGGTSGWTAAEILEAESILNRSRRSQTAENMPKMTKKTDIFSLGCIYYFVLTKGEHPFGNNERLRDYHIETDQNVLKTAKLEKYNLRLSCNLTLFENMLAKDPNLRPDVEYILAHPIFWTNKKMIEFIDEVSNFVNKPTPENEDLCTTCVDKLERNFFPKISSGSPDGWFDSLDSTLKPIFIERYKNHKDKAIMLVRTLRNYKHHYHEKNFEPDVKKHIGEMPDDFMVYWLRTFPTLLNEMRDAFVDLRDKTNFKEYF